MSCLLCNSLALEQFSLTYKDFCSYRSFVFSCHTLYTSNLQIGQANSLFKFPYIFFGSEYFRSSSYPAAQQRLILKVHIFFLPNRFGEIFDRIRYCFKCELIFLTWNVFNISSSLFAS